MKPTRTKEKNGMRTKIFIAIYIPNSFIVNILSPREGKRLSNYLGRKHQQKVPYDDCLCHPDPITTMTAIGNSCFSLVDF